jgi:hypothetical protein
MAAQSHQAWRRNRMKARRHEGTKARRHEVHEGIDCMKARRRNGTTA